MRQQNADVAQEAFEHWRNERYGDCVLSLKKIEANLAASDEAGSGGPDEKSKGDALELLKVEHNLALAEFADSARKDTGNLGEQFAKILTRLDEEIKRSAQASASSGEQGGSERDSSSTNGKEAAAASTGKSGDSGNDGSVAVEGTGPGGKSRYQPDSSFALYNTGVVYVYTRKWRSALTVLEDLFRYIDAVDENLALSICFLLLDVYTLVARGSGYGDGGLLLGHIVEKAQSVIDYLEKPHYFNGHQDWSKKGSDNTTSSDNAAVGDGAASKSQKGSESGPRSISETMMRDIAHRMSNFKIKLLLIQASISSAKAGTVSAELDAQLELAKTRESAKAEDKGAGPKDEDWQGLRLGRTRAAARNATLEASMLTCLKANVDYLRGSFDACRKLLQNAATQGLHPSLLLNNLGCIHHMLGKHNCAARYFVRALDMANEGGGTKQEKEGAEDGGSAKVEPEIAFNLGVQLLKCAKPVLAYDSFMKAAPAGYHRPRLWLHIAECVVMAHAQEAETGQDSLVTEVTGDGAARRILVQTNPISVVDPARATAAAASPKAKLGLDVGLRATGHALYLLRKAESDSVLGHAAMEMNSTGSGIMGSSNSSKPGDAAVIESDADQFRQQALSMKLTALLCRSYLALWMRDWPVAYESSHQVIRDVTAPRTKRLSNADDLLSIAHAYCIEAALRLSVDRPPKSEILDQIVQAVEFDLNAKATTSLQGTSSELKHRSAVSTNLALVRITQNNFPEAERLLLRALDINPFSSHAIRLLIYLYLRRGDQDRARRLLKTMR
ncbi:CCR4-NOT transcription complex subunit 10 [Durusdinium trenchii]|uniref:CCR4-NOT transcription complex subunit 10 n=1 Tax=Durusdinium trenchii TaxID=1381693 RepID=A0ABP0RDI0_9DINO